MSEQDIISLYNDNFSLSEQDKNSFDLFIEVLLIDGLITINQFNNIMEV